MRRACCLLLLLGAWAGVAAAHGGQVVAQAPASYNVLAYGLKCDGATDDRAALDRVANTLLAVGGGELYFPHTTNAQHTDCLINSALTLPANVTLTFAPGARLKLATGATVTILSALTQTRRHIFYTQGTGAVAFTANTQLGPVYPQWWGAYNAPTDTDGNTSGSINAGSNSLTVGTTTSYAVGQGIYVAGAGANGAPLVSQIRNITGRVVTLADRAGTNVSGAAVWHDETVAIQAALNALGGRRGGVLLLPWGVYKVNRDEDATTHGILSLPQNSGAPHVYYHLLGEARTGTAGFSVPVSDGVIIQSSRAGTQPDSAVITAHAAAPSTDATRFNYVEPIFENLTIRTTDNPTRCGLQLSNASNAFIRHCIVDTGVAVSSMTRPTTNRAAIWLPQVNNFVFQEVSDTIVAGYDHGYRFSEHARFVNAFAAHCNVGFLGEFGHHLNTGYINVEHCPVALRFAGPNYVDFQLNIQIWTAVSGGAPWYASAGTEIVEDAAGLAHGRVAYKTTIAGIGPTLAALGSNIRFGSFSLRNLATPDESVGLRRTRDQVINSGAAEAIQFDTATDPAALFDANIDNTAIVIKHAGTYTASAGVEFARSNAGTERTAAIVVVRGAALLSIASDRRDPSALGPVRLNLGGQFAAERGDKVRLLVTQDSGGPLPVVASSGAYGGNALFAPTLTLARTGGF